jgi:hypothetical protein
MLLQLIHFLCCLVCVIVLWIQHIANPFDAVDGMENGNRAVYPGAITELHERRVVAKVGPELVPGQAYIGVCTSSSALGLPQREYGTRTLKQFIPRGFELR